MITERCGCVSASSGAQLAAADELGDERVVVGELLQPSPPGSGRRANRRRGRSRLRRPRRARRSSSSPSPRPRGPRSLARKTRRFASSISAATRASPPAPSFPLSCKRRRRPGSKRPRPPSRRPCRRRPRTAAAARRTRPRCAGASPAVGERRCARRLQPHSSYLRSVSPTRITSPGSASAAGHLMPFTKVPLVESESSTQTPSRRGSMRAWWTEAKSSASRTRSFSDDRAERDRRRVELALGARVDCRAGEDDQHAGVRPAEPRGRGLLRRQDEALLWQAKILGDGADDPPDEEVEQEEKADLEAEQDRFDLDRGDDHGRLKTSSVDPSVIRSSSSSFARFNVLAVDRDAVRGAEVDDPVRRAVLADLGVPSRDVGIGDTDVAVLRAADDDARLLELVRPAVDRHASASARAPARARIVAASVSTGAPR